MEGERRKECTVPREEVKGWQMRRTSNEWVMEALSPPILPLSMASGQGRNKTSSAKWVSLFLPCHHQHC
jgi:hypothetical protein